MGRPKIEKGLGQRPKPVISKNRLRENVRGRNDLAHGSGVHGVDRVAAAELVSRVSGASIGDRGRGRVTTDVRSEVRFRRGADTRLFGFQRPLLLRTIDLAEVVDASIHLGRGARFHEVGNRDRGQETDDGHNDHDFNERKARVLVVTDLHSYLPFFLCRGVNIAAGGL